MKKNISYFPKDFFIFIIVIAMMLLTGFSGCKEDEPTSLYDPNYITRIQPIVDSLSPSGGALAGIDVITVHGKNFSTVKTENTIYFDIQKGTIQTATATQLTVKVPLLVKDTVAVKVSVVGADKFSEIKTYKLIGAVSEFGALSSFEDAYAIACDKIGNLYASLVLNSIGNGIRKFTPSGDTSTFAPKGSETNWTAIKVGSDGTLYACRNQFAIFSIAAGAKSIIFKSIPGSKLYDLDFDKNLNIWSGGAFDSIYKIQPDKSHKGFFFASNANVRSVRIYKDFLYVGGKVDSIEGVWRAPIDGSGSLGTFQKYFDLSAQPGYSYNGANVTAITFNSDGDLYIGTNGKDGILLVHSSSPTTAEPFYSGLFVANAENYSFAWGSGTTLYVTRRNNAIITISQILIKINTQKQSAPYYGRGDI
ncbi:MAG: IPT/TIG domain-containing protein [Bacteroidota bacterium]|nr:IPT/TIG domain-containing protein [Bacteroidota bacterium]